MKVTIAVVQYEITQFSPDKNLARMEKFVKRASSLADLIVFPEDAVTGPLCGRMKFADITGRYKQHFQQLAKKYKIDIVPGSIIEDVRGKFYNTTYYINADGEVKGHYQKVNLWHPERTYLTPGKRASIANTRFGKVGLIICWDLIFPEIFREMMKQNVEIVICPSYWCYGDAGTGIKHDPQSEIKLVDSLCVSRAFEHEIIMVYCNAAGMFQLEKYTDTLLGHSQITMPFKGCVKKLDHHKEEMFLYDIDTSILQDAEEVYRIRKDMQDG